MEVFYLNFCPLSVHRNKAIMTLLGVNLLWFLTIEEDKLILVPTTYIIFVQSNPLLENKTLLQAIKPVLSSCALHTDTF